MITGRPYNLFEGGSGVKRVRALEPGRLWITRWRASYHDDRWDACLREVAGKGAEYMLISGGFAGHEVRSRGNSPILTVDETWIRSAQAMILPPDESARVTALMALAPELVLAELEEFIRETH